MSSRHRFRRFVPHLVGFNTILLGLAGLAIAYGGFADAWLLANASCGNGSDTHLYGPCDPGEAQGVIAIISWIFLGAGILVSAVVALATAGADPGSNASQRRNLMV